MWMHGEGVPVSLAVHTAVWNRKGSGDDPSSQ